MENLLSIDPPSTAATSSPLNGCATTPAMKLLRLGVVLGLWALVIGIWVQTTNAIRAENLLRQGRFLAEKSPTSNKRLQFILDALKIDPTSLEARQDMARFVDNETKIRFQNKQYNLIKEADLLESYNNLDRLIDAYPYQPRILRQKADLANILSIYYMERRDQEKVDFYSKAYFDYNFQAYRQLAKPLELPQKFNLDVLISANNVKQFAFAAEVLGNCAFVPELSLSDAPQSKQIALNTWLNLNLNQLLYDQLYTELQIKEQQLPLIQRYLFTLDQNSENRKLIAELLMQLKSEGKLFEHGELYLNNLLKTLDSKPTELIQPESTSAILAPPAEAPLEPTDHIDTLSTGEPAP